MWPYILIGTSGVFFFVAIVKCISIFNTMRWLHSYSLAFTERLEVLVAAYSGGSIPVSIIYQVYEETEGVWLPFGIKDYRLHRLLRSDNSIMHVMLKFVRTIFFTYYGLVGVLGCFVLVIATFNKFWWHLGFIVNYYLLAICVLMSLMNLLMTAEFIYGSLSMPDYLRNFRVIGDQGVLQAYQNRLSNRSSLADVAGLLILLVLICVVAFSGFCSAYLGVVALNSYKLGDSDVLTTLSLAEWGKWDFREVTRLVLILVYYVTNLLSTTGFADIYPSQSWAGGWAYVVGIVLHVEVVFLLIFAVGILWSTHSSIARR